MHTRIFLYIQKDDKILLTVRLAEGSMYLIWAQNNLKLKSLSSLRNVQSKYRIVLISQKKSYGMDTFISFKRCCIWIFYHLAVLPVAYNNFMKSNQGGFSCPVLPFSLSSHLPLHILCRTSISTYANEMSVELQFLKFWEQSTSHCNPFLVALDKHSDIHKHIKCSYSKINDPFQLFLALKKIFGVHLQVGFLRFLHILESRSVLTSTQTSVLLLKVSG